MHLHIQSHKLVLVLGMHCPLCTSSTSSCAFVYKLELDLKEDNLTELLAVQHKELTNENEMELEAQRKDMKTDMNKK